MGILNLTPDSFYDGGFYNNESYLRRVEQILEEGAHVIDIGAMSSRPGSDFISEEEEFNRLMGPIEAIVKNFPEAILSIDSWRSGIIKASHERGVHIVNDISAGSLDKNLFDVVAECGMPYILMHMKGIPKTMQQKTDYQNIGLEILDFFIDKISILREKGVKDIVLDPGFGFGKTLEQNYSLLAGLHNFKMLECPILVGLSRKSMIYKALDTTAEKALNGTTAAQILALEEGAKILRVHDIKEASETIKIWKLYKSAQ